MRSILLFLIILSAAPSYAQAPLVQWQRSLGGSDFESAQCINRTTDGGYIVASTTGSSNGQVGMNKGGYDCWIVKLTSWGDIAWKKSIGGSQSDYANAVVQTSDGGYIFGGYTQSSDGDVLSNHGSFDFWIVKMDDTGHIQWQRSLGGSAKEIFNALQQTSDGGYIIVGNTESTDGDVTVNQGNEDVWVVKLSAAGSIEWQKTYGGTNEDDGTAIKQTTDGGYIVTSNTKSNDGDVSGNHGGDDIWVLKLTATGTLVWSQCYGGSGTEQDGDHAYPGSVDETTDGGYIFAGITNSADGDVTGYHGGTFFDYWVVKVSATGGIAWAKTFGGTQDDDAYHVQQVPGGGYIVAGTSNSFDGDVTGALGTFDYWILKLTDTGSIEWQKNYGGTGDEYPYCIRAVSGNEFAVCGYSKSNNGDVSGNNGNYDSWVVKLAYCTLPAAGVITGPAMVCTGAAINLSSNTTGGTWSASNGNITVASGAATGVYAGNATVFYTITNSCGTGGATHMVAVNALPVPVISAAGSTLSTTAPFTAYQWLKDGMPISGATNATYTTTLHDTFSVIVTNAAGCSDTSAMYVSGLAIADVNNIRTVSIAPNPAKDMIFIHGMDNVVIRVYNLMGQLVEEGNNTNSISVAALPAGMYLVRVFGNDGSFVQQEKVVKE